MVLMDVVTPNKKRKINKNSSFSAFEKLSEKPKPAKDSRRKSLGGALVTTQIVQKDKKLPQVEAKETFVTPRKKQKKFVDNFVRPRSETKRKTPKPKQSDWEEVEVAFESDEDEKEESVAVLEKSISSRKKVKKSAKKSLSLESEIKIDQQVEKKFKVAASNVKQAVAAVIKFTRENPKLKNKLFDDDQFPLFLQVNSIKVPKIHSKILRIELANSLLNPDSEICLIVPDVKGIPNKEHEKHLEFYQDLLCKRGVKNIKKIMTFHEFRTEYETFELKKKLVELYDVFLVDGKISGKVVQKGGKMFYKKRKVPTPIKLHVTKLKEHIEKTLQKTPLYVHGKGDSFVVQFGHSKMEMKQLVENVYSVLEGLAKGFPGGVQNVRSLNLYTFRGMTIPIYASLKNQNAIVVSDDQEKIDSKKFQSVSGELSTRLNTEVTVEPTGEVTLKRIEDDDEDDNNITRNVNEIDKVRNGKSSKKEKKMKRKPENSSVEEIPVEFKNLKKVKEVKEKNRNRVEAVTKQKPKKKHQKAK